MQGLAVVWLVKGLHQKKTLVGVLVDDVVAVLVVIPKPLKPL